MAWWRNHGHRVGLAGVLAMTAVLCGWGIWNQGWGNEYYTAAVQSMLQSPKAFFFAGLDAGSYITVDKPALGLWLQCLSAAVFGVHGWSVILPEVLCSVASVAVLYRLVARDWGWLAGLIAAAALALTSIFVAVSRTNNLDASLILVLVLAADALLRAAERGSIRWLLVSMALVGLGFNIKMLQAWLILPALLGAYLAAANVGWRRRAAHLAAAVAVVVAVSFSWALIVDAIPASDRPYVGGSQTDSVLELIFDYNGLQRVVSGYGMGGGMGLREGGEPGILRLFNDSMGGQASWLLPLTPFGMLVLALGLERDRKRRALRHLVVWAGWLLPCYAYFCVSGFFHRYYLATMAPAIAALVGIGVVGMMRLFRRPGWQGHLLPVALGFCAVVQFALLRPYQSWGNVLVPVVAGVLLVAVVGLLAVQTRRRQPSPAAVKAFAAVGVAALLATPAVWSVVTVASGTQTVLPLAGPTLQEDRGGGGWQGGSGGQGPGGFGGGPGGGQAGTSQDLVDYLTEHHNGETFLAAVPSANTAASLMLETGQPVMAVGGFMGSDPALTVEELERMVANRELRYFLVGWGREGGNDAIMNWVKEHGTLVAQEEWEQSGGTLYDLNPEENDVIDAGEGLA